MAMKQMTMAAMEEQANKITDYYAKLQEQIYWKLIDATKNIKNVQADNILEWRLQQLAKMGALTDNVIEMVSKMSGTAESMIREMIKKDGLQVAKQLSDELGDAVAFTPDVSPEVKDIITGYLNQTFSDMDNNVNQTLLTTNYGENAAMRAYQGIINQTVLEVQTGLKTPQRALADNVYKWHDKGLESGLVDKGGHRWSLEGYTRTVMNTTAGRVFNDVSIQSMEDFGTPLATMTSHPASREACAGIQGHIVNIVPTNDPNFDSRYDSIYNHGYGEPAGTLGINCGHHLYPYVPRVSHNVQPQYDPKEAVENMKIQQQQRGLERRIRADKALLSDAERLGDEQGVQKYKARIRGNQRALRGLVSKHDFLTRQYDREQIYTGRSKGKPIKGGIETSPITPAKLGNIKLGKPMSMARADNYHANPKYWGETPKLQHEARQLKEDIAHYRKMFDEMPVKDHLAERSEFYAEMHNRAVRKYNKLMSDTMPYHVNCQRAAPAYELRRRGYNVTALPNHKNLSHHDTYEVPARMWRDDKGRVETATPLQARNNESVTRELTNQMVIGERGTVDWCWAGESVGHIINVERTKTGLKFVDAQGGVMADSFEEYMNGKKFRKRYNGYNIGVNYLRVDDKYIDEKSVPMVVTKK